MVCSAVKCTRRRPDRGSGVFLMALHISLQRASKSNSQPTNAQATPARPTSQLLLRLRLPRWSSRLLRSRLRLRRPPSPARLSLLRLRSRLLLRLLPDDCRSERLGRSPLALLCRLRLRLRLLCFCLSRLRLRLLCFGLSLLRLRLRCRCFCLSSLRLRQRRTSGLGLLFGCRPRLSRRSLLA